MGVEKTLLSKMLVPGTHRRIYAIDRHVGLVRSLTPAPIQRLAALTPFMDYDRCSRWPDWLPTAGSW